jgi:hypothetical protein
LGALHTVSHVPQCSGSVWRSTHWVPQHFSRVGHGPAQAPPLLLEEPVPEDPLLLPEVLVLAVPLLPDELETPLLLEELLAPAVPPVDALADPDPVVPPSPLTPSSDASDPATNAEPPHAVTMASRGSVEATAKEDRMTHTLPVKL